MKIPALVVSLALLILPCAAGADTLLPAVTGAAEKLAAAATSPGNISLPVSATGELFELRYLDVAQRWNDSFGEWETVWQGEVEGVPGSLAVFTTIGGHTAGTVVLPDRILRVLPSGEASVVPADLSCGTPPAPALHEEGAPSVSDALLKATPAPVEIVLALPYSPAARDAAGGAAAIRALLANQQNLLNAAFARSGLGHITVKVVGIQRVEYFESDPRRSGHNYFNNRTRYFRNLRNSWKADLVMLTATFVPGGSGDGGLAGVAYQFTGDPALAYGMVRLNHLEYALLHEVGHLLSATHEQGYFGCPSGGQFLGVDFYTVMWVTGLPPCAPERLIQFSNPAVIHAPSGLPTGKARTNDNASRVQAAAPRVAQFRK